MGTVFRSWTLRSQAKSKVQESSVQTVLAKIHCGYYLLFWRGAWEDEVCWDRPHPAPCSRLTGICSPGAGVSSRWFAHWPVLLGGRQQNLRPGCRFWGLPDWLPPGHDDFSRKTGQLPGIVSWFRMRRFDNTVSKFLLYALLAITLLLFTHEYKRRY